MYCNSLYVCIKITDKGYIDCSPRGLNSLKLYYICVLVFMYKDLDSKNVSLGGIYTRAKATSFPTCCIVSYLSVYTKATAATTKIKEKNRFQLRIQGGAARRTPPPASRPNIFSILWSFRENLTKSYVGAPSPPPGGLVPLPTGNLGSAPGFRFRPSINAA